MIDSETNIDNIYYLENINDCNGTTVAAGKRDPSRKDNKKISMIGGSNALSSTDKSLGTWMFDKRTKRRKYISLTGKVFFGPEAIRMSRVDKQCLVNPMKTARYELKYLMTMTNPISWIIENMHDPELTVLSQLKSWSIPNAVILRYERMRVKSLFPWQIECLTVDQGAVLKDYRNLIYSAPTSGGKTLVAEILMLRQLSRHIASPGDAEDSSLINPSIAGQRPECRRHTVFFVVPFVALAEEKASYFQDIWQEMNIGVKAFHGDGGDVSGNVLTEDVEVAVCTIERANILLTQLLDEGREDQLKMVVIDEIHMLSDAHRGFLLEVMLSKVKYLLRDRVQVVGMSATLPNIADLAGWLDASLYTTQYRPVELEVKVCLSKTLHSIEPRRVRSSSLGDPIAIDGTFDFVAQRSLNHLPDDPDGLRRLCLETVAINKSVMLFCNTKRRCEVCAASIADAIKKSVDVHASKGRPGVPSSSSSSSSSSAVMKSLPNRSKSSLPWSLSNHQSEEDKLTSGVRMGRIAMIESLSQTQVGLCPILRDSIPGGVAYHHAGLTLDERKVIEDGFRSGFIQVLCTTSTLSAGVNLPAHRVIIRSPLMGDKYLNVSGFRQMCGRAGRMGLDTKGEAILMIAAGNKTERAIAETLLTADLEPLCSSLHNASGGGLEKLLLEMVSCGKLTKEEDVLRFISCTLMVVQQREDLIRSYTTDALYFLKKEQFIQSLGDGKLSPTPLGVATTISGIAPKDAVVILKPLMDARHKLILKGGLHPVYLVTPPSTAIEPDWKNYERMLDLLYQEQPDAINVANYLGIDHGQISSFAFNLPARNNNSPQLQLYRRFYSAILLFSLIQEWPITNVTRIITNATRGQLQQLQKDAAVFCGMTVVFCKKLNWHLLGSCLDDFSSRLNYGVHKDILPLVRLGSELTASRARILHKSGIESAQDILFAGVAHLTELLQDSLPYDGNDPLMAQQNQTSSMGGESAGSQMDDTTGVVDDRTGCRSKDRSLMVCERLAKKILLRAKDYLVQEAARINSHNMIN